MKKELDGVRIRAREVATKAMACIKEGKLLEKLLEEAPNHVKGMKKEASSLKDEIVAVSD